MSISTLIVEDEHMGRIFLKSLIEDYCPQIQVFAEAASIEEAKEAIQKQQPELVFLDIHLPDGDGFHLLNAFPKREFEVIFTTAHEEHALRAFEHLALQYLLKPVEIAALQAAVSRFEDIWKQRQRNRELNAEIKRKEQQQGRAKIAIPMRDEILFVSVDDIIRCEADSSYTHIYLSKEKHIMASKPLGHYENLLSEYGFFRVHDKHLINLQYVEKYVKGQGGQVLLCENHSVDVATRRRDSLLEKLL